MVDFFLRIYDFLCRRRRWTLGLMFALMGVLLAMMSSLRYDENINDFLPISGTEQDAIALYQDIAGGQRIFALFRNADGDSTDTQRLTEAVDAFAENLQRGDGARHVKQVTTQVDFDKFIGITNFMYRNVPLMLTDSDYVRMERLLAAPDYVNGQLARDVESMLMPGSGLFSANIGYDPLSLFAPVMHRLEARQSSMPFEIDDGYIFTPGGKYAVAMVTSPYGAMESAENSRLVAHVDSVAVRAMQAVPEVEVSVTGSPVIAVDNASQIKADSQWAISLAVTLILLLLMFAFRKVKHLLLIGLAIVFGWLFAMGFIAVLHSDVSLIVIGIGSIIIGIAVNYPLHFIAHTAHGETVREVLKDMVAPLLIGNITTVGAFASLMPLDAPALRDLGLFAAFMLIGTILFVLVFLPHLVSKSVEKREPERLLFGRISSFTPERHGWLMWVIAVLTLVFGYFSLDISFDTNMQHINYLTPTQKALLTDLHPSAGINDTANVYVVTRGSTYDEALERRERLSPLLDSLRRSALINGYSDATALVCSRREQQRRIQLWNAFWDAHRDEVLAQLARCAPDHGFSDEAFSGFAEIVSAEYAPMDFSHFDDLRSVLLPNSFSQCTGDCSVVDVVDVRGKDMSSVVSTLNEALDGDGYSFDVVGMNSAVARTLSNDFNYIGFACGVIVFAFLWLSFGHLELALLAFLPMALGWIWILGMMQLLGMKFNIVNVILATFIFGQGDDYTIFITDGLINEYAYRRKLLPSFKNSIAISALIMFIGMGSLIVARHPALHSLAEVTIVGMCTVVLMAWVVPPMVFSWLVATNGRPRRVPVTIEQVIRITYCAVVYLFQVAYGTICAVLATCGTWRRRERQLWMHKVIQRAMLADITHIWGVPVHIRNIENADFSHPSIIICNHQSLLDPIYILALDPRIVIVMGSRVWHNPIVHRFFTHVGFLTVDQPYEQLRQGVTDALAQGYSVAIFPEGLRTYGERIARFHKGAFNMAHEIGADIQPIFLHGTAHIMTRGSAFPPRGRVDVELGRRISRDELATFGDTEQAISQALRRMYQARFRQLCREIETTHYFHDYIIYKYMYKGIELERQTRRLLRRHDDFSRWIDGFELRHGEHGIYVANEQRGQFSLLFALVHPHVQVHAFVRDDDDQALMRAMNPMPANLTVHDAGDEAAFLQAESRLHVIDFNEVLASRG